MNTEWIKARQTKYGAYLAVYLIVIIGVLAVANWLASTNDKSFDTTSNKRFSLSDQTIKVAQNLKNDVKIYYFDRSDRFTGAHDLLDRYSALSPKVKVVIASPLGPLWRCTSVLPWPCGPPGPNASLLRNFTASTSRSWSPLTEMRA